MRYLIIGGVASGASFACRLRRLDEQAEIKIYEKTNFVSYANCGLPYFIGDVIKEESSLTLQTPYSLKARFNIDVKVNSEVIKINKEDKTIVIKDLKTNEVYLDYYDKLIIATGAEAIKIAPLSNKIYELKTVEDSIKIKSIINSKENNIKDVIVIGGGFIGLEISENLVKANKKVTLIEGSNHCLASLDLDMASFLHNVLRNNGINLLLNTLVIKIEEVNNKVRVYFKDNSYLESDILIESIGVKPSSKLAKEAGLDLDFKDSIKVNNNFQTSDKDIYAIGDVTSIKSFIDNEITYIPLAGLANKEGRELANYLVNNENIDLKALGTSILKIFSLNIASTGFNEEILRRKGIPYEKIYLSPLNHASYYLEASPLTIKVMFDKSNFEILGAEIIGNGGVDKRIDVLSTAIKFNIKGYDLTKLELSYAPPFSSAKDPINMIGYIIENIKNGLIRQHYFEEVDSLIHDKNVMLVDVRSKEEYELGHIPSSINIPLDELRDNLSKLDKNKEIVLICQSALRSYIGCRILSNLNYNTSHLAGGYRIYSMIKHDQGLTN